MGYYTTYNLHIDTPHIRISDEEILKELKQKISKERELELLDILRNKISAEDIIKDFRNTYEDANYAIDEDGCCNESCKWYDHEKELLEFSKKYPSVLFILEGEGEESGDIWKKYFKNGKAQYAKAKLIFEEYDEKKLK